MVKVKVDNLFFELMQVALGKRSVLSKTPSEREWQELFDMAEKQAVAGVAMAALEKLSEQGQKPPMGLLYEWIGLSEQVRQENLRLNRCCRQLQRKLGEAGLRSSILKGQGILPYYDESLRELRQPGDIDIYVDCGMERALNVVQQVKGPQDSQARMSNQRSSVKVEKWDYKHAHLDIWDDVSVEMHYRVEVMLNLYKNRKLQKWFKFHTEEIFSNQNLNDCSAQRDACLSKNLNTTTDGTDADGLVTPTVEFNVFYILLHVYRHFLYEGIGMRQLMDYYFVLKNLNLLETLREQATGGRANADLNLNDNLKSNRTTYALDAIKVFGMERFARGVMWVMQEVFALERTCMIAEPLESEGRFILNEVMVGGNFGHYDERINKRHQGKFFTVMAICKHNWHLLWHYPSEVIWPPVWFVWHKCWKWQKMLN